MTPRQRQIMAEVATGADYATVAERLGISLQHVKNTMNIVRRRLNCDSTIEVFATIGWLRVPAYDLKMTYEQDPDW